LLKKLRGNAGFTLLEVLAVVALLGVLGAMLLPSLDSAAGRAKNARLESDLATIDNAILLYKMDNGTWTCGKDGQSCPVTCGMPSALVSKLTVGGEN